MQHLSPAPLWSPCSESGIRLRWSHTSLSVASTDQSSAITGRRQGKLPPRWQVPAQWRFWTLYAYYQAQGSYSRGSQSIALEACAPLLARDCLPPCGTKVGMEFGAEVGTGICIRANPSTEHEDPAQSETRKPEGQEGLVSPRASSSSSPDKVVAGSSTAPTPVDNRAHKELLWRVAQKLGLQAEEVVESGPHGGHFSIRRPLKGGIASHKYYVGHHQTLADAC